MLIVSFSWTVEALRSGNKICTRRNWNDQYAQRFIRAYQLGHLIAGWNQLPRVHGHQVGTLKLTEEPYKQRTSLMTEQDYIDEGLAWMDEHNLRIQGITPRQFFEDWKRADEEPYVIRFRFTPET